MPSFGTYPPRTYPTAQDPPWWQLFEVERHQLYDVCRQLYELYSQSRPTYICLKKDVTTRGAPGQPSPPTHAGGGAGAGATPPLRSPGSAAVSLAGAPTGSAATGAAPRSDGETEQRPNGLVSLQPLAGSA